MGVVETTPTSSGTLAILGLPRIGVVETTPTLPRPAPAWIAAKVTVPKILDTDPIGRRWLALANAAPDGRRWDQDGVDAALRRALGTLVATGGKLGGAKAFRHLWPAVARDIGARGEPPGAAAAALFEMQAVLGWPAKYMDGQHGGKRYPRQMGVLQIWLMCQATGQPFEAALSRRSIKGSTGRRWRWQAVTAIASGLMTDGIPVTQG